MEFNLPKDQTSIIKVVGVGGGGSNAVNHMYNQGIRGVDFAVCNTDEQSLDNSPVPTRIQIGANLTEGRGAGSIPDIGKNAAIESIEEIKEWFADNTKMVFVTAGMGGGTGTGAAPVIAQAAKEMGILTVGIVTVPFSFEGKRRKLQAEDGLAALRENVDTLLVINNDKLRQMFGNLSLGDAFAKADNILSSAAKGIAELISVTGTMNVDFNDVYTVMKDSGVAIMGSAVCEGEGRATTAVEEALASPLLNDNDIAGAQNVLLNITYGTEEVTMDEISQITDYIQDEAGAAADVIWGHGFDENLGGKLSVTVVATGFSRTPITGFEKAPERNVVSLAVAEKKEEPKKAIQEEEDVTFTLKTKEVPPVAEVQPEPTPVVEPVPTPTNEVTFDTPAPINEAPVTEVQEEEQVTFELKEEPAATVEPVKRYNLIDEEDFNASTEPSKEERQEQQQELSEERMKRLERLSGNLRDPRSIEDLESVPAFKRRNINLEDVPHSSESDVSRVSLGKDNEGKTGLSNNSFLHDNVD